jgi:ABC-type sugar transport system ATPase subunit
MMVGRSVKEFYQSKERLRGTERLRVEGLTRWGFFHDVNFAAYQNEILGIGGLSGAGRTELARVLVGLDCKDQGRIFLEGKQVNIRSMGKALDHGLAYLSEDRKSEGLAVRLTVRENALAGLIRRHSRWGVYLYRQGVSILAKLITDLAIYPPDPNRPVSNLSGGNQQKVLLAKWLACEPKVLILDEPTRGVDIGAKMIIHQAIEKIADQGHTVILISSDLPELVRLSDRILIMRQGRFIREMSKDECTEETILLAANADGGINEN